MPRKIKGIRGTSRTREIKIDPEIQTQLDSVVTNFLTNQGYPTSMWEKPEVSGLVSGVNEELQLILHRAPGEGISGRIVKESLLERGYRRRQEYDAERGEYRWAYIKDGCLE